MDNIGQRHPLNILGVVLSFWNQRGKSNKAFLEVIENTFPKKLLNAKVRRDISVTEASIFGKPVFETAPVCRASEDYIAVTKELLKRI
jgi:chromosome partitioning protein